MTCALQPCLRHLMWVSRISKTWQTYCKIVTYVFFYVSSLFCHPDIRHQRRYISVDFVEEKKKVNIYCKQKNQHKYNITIEYCVHIYKIFSGHIFCGAKIIKWVMQLLKRSDKMLKAICQREANKSFNLNRIKLVHDKNLKVRKVCRGTFLIWHSIYQPEIFYGKKSPRLWAHRL